jgi:heat shock protein HslJ
MRKISLLLLGVLLLAASCGGNRSGSGQWPTGRTFLSTSVTEHGKDRPLVGGTRIELRFAEGRLMARAGCNHLDGDGRIEDNRLVVDELGTTDMGCEPGRMAQDSWLSEFLSARPTWELSGDDLVLRDADTQIRLTDRRLADPDRPLIGTRWIVDSIISRDTVSSVPAGVEAYLQLDTAGGFQGSTGCVRITGSAAVRAERITFSLGNTPSLGCTGAAAALQSAVLGVLRGEVGYRIEATRLTLTGADGAGLGLRAAA